MRSTARTIVETEVEANVEERAPGRYAQGPVLARERRPPRLERARAVLRELAGLPGRVGRRLGDDLRRRGERVARLRDLAQRRPRRGGGGAGGGCGDPRAEGG